MSSGKLEILREKAASEMLYRSEKFKWTILLSWCKKPRFDFVGSFLIGEKNE
jgi:hypothetical protein